jgi:flagellin-like protein
MKFERNDEAVSPVIGVILMVAITVILAAVIAAFVFGMGPPKQAPQASITATINTSASDVKLEHQGGSDITLSDAKIIVEQGSNRVQWATSGNTIDRMVAGDKLELFTNASSNIKLNGVDLTNGTFSGAAYTTQSGQDVTMTMIDIPSGQQIAVVKIRA